MAILQELSYSRTLSKSQLYSFTEIDKPILKLWKCKLPKIAKTTLIKKKLGGLTLFNFNYSVIENTPVSHLYYCLYSQNTSVFSILLHCWSLSVQRFFPLPSNSATPARCSTFNSVLTYPLGVCIRFHRLGVESTRLPLLTLQMPITSPSYYLCY